MDTDCYFETQRPYQGEEVAAAMARIAADPVFPRVAKFIYPQRSVEETAAFFRTVTTLEQVQQPVMVDLVDQILAHTVSNFSFSGVENLDAKSPYFFVSNHRDISLDAMLLQYTLAKAGIAPSHVGAGANLICLPVIADFFKLNRIFSIARCGSSPKEFYQALSLLSSYMHHLVVDCKESVWIAQRNGRTKDGDDVTDPAIVKMFALAGSGTLSQRLQALHLAPFAISYQWEPCDMLKAVELAKSQFGKYVKAPKEDLNSILVGIRQLKGGVSLDFTAPLTDKELADTCNDARRVATLIDQRIHHAYHLWPNNYVAYDFLHSQNRYADRYTHDEQVEFDRRLVAFRVMALDAWHTDEAFRPLRPVSDEEFLDTATQYFVEIYANPVRM